MDDFVFVEVITKQLYMLPNNHSLNEFLATFDKDLNRHHAWREGSRVGNSKRLVNVKVLDSIEDYDKEK